MIKYLNVLLITILLFNCESSKIILKKNSFVKKQNIKIEGSRKALNNWSLLDIERDSIPGLSFNKAYNSILKNKKGSPIIVAVLDSEIDINHNIFKNKIWINKKEIPNNDLDDDGNNYIDDINGWNFLGNKKGDNIINANYEYVRIYKYLSRNIHKKDTISDEVRASGDFKRYNIIKKKYLKNKKSYRAQLDYSNKISLQYENAKEALKDYFPTFKFNEETLKTIDTTNNDLANHVKFISAMLKYKETDESMRKGDQRYKDIYYKRANVEFNERKILEEDPNNILDSDYGNNNVLNNLEIYSHGTKVAGLIVSEAIKIMPVCISPYGDEHDKDIALAIRYAVDNGARVINMSFGKKYSLHKDWVFDAFKYAEANNVLIISSAGNSKYNLNIENNYYPNDNIDNGLEVSNNFLLIGGSTVSANENLYMTFSNYGNIDVDIFAPADSIYTTIPKNKYTYDSGTSLAAALTSKVAALIFSHYPNLTASQVKHIIMDSGVEYTFPVKTPTEADKDKMTPFNELSKSGKIVNAYNALIMADSVSKSNKRKHE